MTCIRHRNARRLQAFRSKTPARTLLAAAMAIASTLPAQAAPAGGVVAAGAGAITQQGSTTTITQTANQAQQPARMVINWNSFSSAAGESIVFRQPNAAAIALNRVTGASPSALLGSLSANGQVFILNPNGVLFGAGSKVDVQGLLATTLGMNNADFMAGNYALRGSSGARVENRGSLKVNEGGYIALAGPTVVNDGSIVAGRGDALLAAGDKVTLRLEGGSLIGYSMDLGSANALVDNTANGVISANGGRVVLEASAADALSRAVVNHAGLIEARTLDNSKGSIRLLGDPNVGQTHVSGTLDASAPSSGNGGFIETSGAQVKIEDSARVTTAAPGGVTGTWLIDPVDFEIAPDGGPLPPSSISAATLSTQLATNSVTIGTSTSGAGTGKGDITVNADVAWSSRSRLTLQAYRNIIFNASLRGNAVSLLYGQASTDGGAADYYFNNGAKIDLTGANPVFDTQKGSLANVKRYTIVRSLGTQTSTDPDTLQGMSRANSDANFVLGADIDAAATKDWADGAGFNSMVAFGGSFDGLGHQISNLTINKPQLNSVGLFSNILQSGEVRNLALNNVNVNASSNIGGVAGQNLGLISRTSVTGSVKGVGNVGGLVGINSGKVVASSSSASVVGSSVVGGLVGSSSGNISNSYSAGSASATLVVGGLVGESAGTIQDSYSQAQVDSVAGGVGGGLAGRGMAGSVTRNSFATGKMSNTDPAASGGLMGSSSGSVIDSYWNTDAIGGTGMSTSAAGTGKTGAQLRDTATFKSWDIAATGGTDSVWRIYEGKSMPLLRSFLSPLVLAPLSLEYSGKVQQNTAIAASGTRTGTAASGRYVGTYLPYSNQQGYDISDGELVITPKPLNITVTGADKVYDSKPEASVTLLARPFEGDDVLTAGYSSATFSDKNVGAGKTVTVSGIRIVGTDAFNYSYQPQANTTASITPRPLEISVTGVDRVYDGTTSASATLFPKPLGPDVLSASYQSATFADKNVGEGKSVTVSGFTLSGTDAANYIAPSEKMAIARITPRPLEFTVTGVDKVYDSTTDASATLVAKPLGGDDLKAVFKKAEFGDKSVGTGKKVILLGVTLDGADVLNYSPLPLLSTNASITPRPLDILATGGDKIYDGNTNASATLLAKPLNGDVLGAAYATAAFDDKNAGNAKNVTVSGLTLSGRDGANYTAPSQVNTSANITPRPLDITATATDKIYDGFITAQAVLHDNRVAGDTLVTTAVASFDDKNAGAGKPVTVSGVSIGGADAGNYRYTPQAMRTTASITPRSLDITATATDKSYDGTTRASATLSDDHIAGDAVTASYQRAEFADQNGGQKKLVTVSGIALAGADAPNYVASDSVTASASIAPLNLTVTANPDSRLATGVPYRGGNGVAYSGFLAGESAAVLGGQLRYGGNAQNATKEGVYRITPGGLTSANYAITFVDGTLTIQPLPPGAGQIASYVEPALPAPPVHAGRNAGTAILRVIECGMRMPENLLLGGCQPGAEAGGATP